MSAAWNSGRLRSIRATRSPRRRPRAPSPAAIRPAASAYSDHVRVGAPSPGPARRATTSGRAATVERKASVIVFTTGVRGSLQDLDFNGRPVDPAAVARPKPAPPLLGGHDAGGPEPPGHHPRGAGEAGDGHHQ